MKKNFFFILLIILIIIIFCYNDYYEHFSVKVRDAMIFKDYNNNIIGTYPAKPSLFDKKNGEYINFIGTVYGVSQIKLPKQKDGDKGPDGAQGMQGSQGLKGQNGISGYNIVQNNIDNNLNTTCIVKSNNSILIDDRSSSICKGPPGNNGKSPYNGTNGRTCIDQKYANEDGECPPGKPGLPGLTCAQVNPDLFITGNKCPDGANGVPGKTCVDQFPQYINGYCPIPENGNDGKTCYEILNSTLSLSECTESTPGVPSIDCINPNNHNIKMCGRINPDIVHYAATDLEINPFDDSNKLTINNNKNIELNGNIIMPANGKIILKDENNITVQTINKSYIDKMIFLSKQCKKCPDQNGKKWWNNSTNCQQDQGDCIECKECESGEYVEQACSEHSNTQCKQCKECESGEYVEQACSQHSNTQCKQCQPGYVGIECSIKCDPIKGEIPRDDKTACKTIGSNKYIDPNDNTKEKDIPSNKYRNPNDARLLNDCSSCQNGKYKTGGCSGTTNTTCSSCPVCSSTQYSSGSCGGSSNNKTCYDCPCGQIPNSNRNGCIWDPYNFYQFYDQNLGGGCSKINNNISHNYWGWNAVASSFLVPRNSQMAVYTMPNYNGECYGGTSPSNSASTFNMPSWMDNNINSIRLNTTC